MSQDVSASGTVVKVDRNPDVCPVCHHAMEPQVIGASLTGLPEATGTYLERIFKCPRHDCQRVFIGRYRRMSVGSGGQRVGEFVFRNAVPAEYVPPEIDQVVLDISPSFGEIVSQSAEAEFHELCEIAGVGYRKALEFLVKDYCIHKNAERADAIKASTLGQVINNYVGDGNIQKCAERAAWLGNDETHYVRKWEDKDIEDLKILIELTSGWVRSNVLTERYLQEMES